MWQFNRFLKNFFPFLKNFFPFLTIIIAFILNETRPNSMVIKEKKKKLNLFNKKLREILNKKID